MINQKKVENNKYNVQKNREERSLFESENSEVLTEDFEEDFDNSFNIQERDDTPIVKINIDKINHQGSNKKF